MNLLEELDKQAVVISGFPGVGKSWFANKRSSLGLKILDSEYNVSSVPTILIFKNGGC